MISGFSIAEAPISAAGGDSIISAEVAMVFDFTQTSVAARIRTRPVDIISTFITVKVASGIMAGASDMSFNFVQSSSGGRLRTNVVSLSSEFVQTTFATRIQAAPDINMEFSFTQTAVGGLTWQKIDPVRVNNWSKISPTGGTWTEIDTNVNVESWSEIQP